MRTLITIVVIILIGGALWAARHNSYVMVHAARATSGPIREFVDEQAQTRLPQQHLITMPFNGRIESIELIEGTPVKRDKIVARVVPLDLELSVADAKAASDRADAAIKENADIGVELTTLEQALKFVESMDSTVKAAEKRVTAGEAKLDFANKQLQRMERMRLTNASTEEQLNSAQVNQVQANVDYQQDVLVLSALRSMQAATALGPTVVRQYISRKTLTGQIRKEELAQAEARLKQQQRDQQRGHMRSPIDGIILARHESNERMVSSGTVLLTIGNLDELEVEADILSQDVVRIQLDDLVEIYGPAIGEPVARGKVARIYPAGFTKVSSLGVEQQRVKVIVQFDGEELKRLRATRDLGVGYRTRVRIFTAEKSDALLVPRSALFRGPTGDWQVFAVRGGVARLQPIRVGLMNDVVAEIVQGIAADELVVLSPETSLVDGVRVRSVIDEQPASEATNPAAE